MNPTMRKEETMMTRYPPEKTKRKMNWRATSLLCYMYGECCCSSWYALLSRLVSSIDYSLSFLHVQTDCLTTRHWLGHRSWIERFCGLGTGLYRTCIMLICFSPKLLSFLAVCHTTLLAGIWTIPTFALLSLIHYSLFMVLNISFFLFFCFRIFNLNT